MIPFPSSLGLITEPGASLSGGAYCVEYTSSQHGDYTSGDAEGSDQSGQNISKNHREKERRSQNHRL